MKESPTGSVRSSRRARPTRIRYCLVNTRRLISLAIPAVWLAGSLLRGQPSAPSVSEVEVEISHGAARLAGTLYLPSSPGPHGAVAVLGGSDRSARGPAKTRLARSLASGGFAALTYDSPGTGRSTGNALLQSRVDRAREGAAVMEFLRSRAEVDPHHVGICGGSEGANVALMAAALDENAAFAIAISGAFGLSMVELSQYRIDAMGLRLGLSDEDILRAHTLEGILYTLFIDQDIVEPRLLRSRTDRWTDEPWDSLIDLVDTCREDVPAAQQSEVWNGLKATLRGWMDEPWFDLAVPDKGNLERVMAMDAPTFFTFLRQSPLASGAWYVSAEEFDLLTGVRCPILAVWGEEDDYLPPHRSAAWLQANLKDAGNREVTLRILPSGNHSMWDEVAQDYAEGYPEILVDWLETLMARAR